MPRQDSDQVTASLVARVREGADAAQIAQLVAATCAGIEVALTPIIGRRGVAALYKRSLYLVAQTHPWVAASVDVAVEPDVAPFVALLARRNGADAAAAGGLLLETFYDLLATLIGPSLTERLLRSVWAIFLSGAPAQDLSP